ncbi:tRNA lysidine(34) synthetase TilS [Leyella stercorea]|uniref:tRNA lysidine(34) synthetase TilS n=1 Tax=Leyella stercorea TaxID=363265 RepID=UPI0026DCE9EE|nr:tRNA lysidine(34) synthetase TilS [Leyella stercorea]
MEKNSPTISTFVDQALRFATAHQLLTPGGKYIIALSGGADSVSLLLVLKHLESELGITLEAAHCNFHLRGDESLRDEEFCKQLCRRLHVPLHLVHFDTHAYADLHHVSIEMAARDLRYAYFEQLRRDIHAHDICVAHHRDDSVETLLLNLVRGTGLRGLRGIQPRNAHIIRPLLSHSRQQIEQYLDALGESYVTDSTNLHNDVKRNKIRLNIIPLLRELNPSVSQSIFETSLRVTEALKVFDEAIQRSIADVTTPPSGDTCRGCTCLKCTNQPVEKSPNQAVEKCPNQPLLVHLRQVHPLSNCPNQPVENVTTPQTQNSKFKTQNSKLIISVPRLKQQPSPEYTLHEILSPRGFTSAQIEQIYTSLDTNPTGKIITSCTHELAFDRSTLILQPKTPTLLVRPMHIPETGTYVLSDNMKLKVETEECGDRYEPSRTADCASLDASDIKFPLTLRHIQPGDRFVPFGMTGTKLLSDYLTDRKKNIFEKRAQLVLTDAQQRILWLVGERTDNRFRITPNTQQALCLTIAVAR